MEARNAVWSVALIGVGYAASEWRSWLRAGKDAIWSIWAFEAKGALFGVFAAMIAFYVIVFVGPMWAIAERHAKEYAESGTVPVPATEQLRRRRSI